MEKKLRDAISEILVSTKKENANVTNSPAAKIFQIGSEASRCYYLSHLIPKEFTISHLNGDFHIHDLDFYGKTLTCLQIPLGQLLKNGFETAHGFIRPPKRLMSATSLAAIILQSSQNEMHGGQSFPFFDTDLALFIGNSTDEEIFQAMEALIFNLNTMHSRSGGQIVFSNLNFGADISENARKVTKNLLLAYKKGLGRGENPIFPNLIFRVKKGINLDLNDPNRDLFELAMQVAGKCMNPTFSFMDSSFNSEYKDLVSYMGCRTRVIANRKGKQISEKRGNLSFTSINLPRLAIRSNKKLKIFYSLLDKMMDHTANQLYHRYKIQSKLKVKDMPFLMGQKLYLDSENLHFDDCIETAIKNGTLSIGFIGLAETLASLIGYHHAESKDAQSLGLEIIQYMSNKVKKISDKFDLNYTFLATPAEGLAGRFINLDKKKYGIIPKVTDKEYYTNSFHVPVSFQVSISDKINIEGPYHKYCNAGHISYIEFQSPLEHNIEAIENIIRLMMKADMGYAGINFPIDFCQACSYKGVINESTCPKCSSTNIKRIRRITGYISSTSNFNEAKLSELQDRLTHA